jgi:hypothetical protein
VGQDKYHGGSSGWPRTTLQGDSFRATFHSDGSQNDWGYKFTATASTPPIAHWADFQMTAALLQPLLESSIAQLFVQEARFHIPSAILPLLDGNHEMLPPSSKVPTANQSGSSDSLKHEDDDEANEEESSSGSDAQTNEEEDVNDRHDDAEDDDNDDDDDDEEVEEEEEEVELADGLSTSGDAAAAPIAEPTSSSTAHGAHAPGSGSSQDVAGPAVGAVGSDKGGGSWQ